jgi:hypothetical protein
MRGLIRRIFTIVLVLLAGRSFAGTITAVSNGNWVVPATWGCGCVPAQGDNVVVPAGMSVKVTRPVMLAPGLQPGVLANGVVVTIAGELDLTNGALQLGPNDQVVVMPGGRIISNGLGGTIYTGITPFTIRSGSVIEGPYTIGGGGFPIALMFFEADVESENDFVTLSWASAGEVNVDSYRILYSNDSINYTNVATIKGLGYSLRRHDYSYHVDSRSSKKKYFRLECTSNDSTIVVLSTIRVNTEP